jgi:DamX protein
MRTEPSFSIAPEEKLFGAEGDLALSESSIADYRQRYGLSVDPFLDDPHFPFYTGAGRRQILDQLLHLCQFSQNVLVVTGEFGSGKTRMAQALIDTLDDADDIGFVEGQINADAQSILTDVFTQFEVADGESFAEFASRSAEQEGLVVLLVDNAHHLSDDGLKVLVELVQSNLESRFHLVLFGEPLLISQLEQINAPDVDMTDFALEPLNLAESVDYLNFRMELSDYLGPEVFTEAKVDHWWHEAQGQLLVLHESAHQYLLASVIEPRKSSYTPKGLPIPHIVAASVLLSVLILGFFYFGGSKDKDSVQKVSLEVPAIQQTIPASSSNLSASHISVSSFESAAQASAPSTAPMSDVQLKSQAQAQAQASVLASSSGASAPASMPSATKQTLVPLAQAHSLVHSSAKNTLQSSSLASSTEQKKTAELDKPEKTADIVKSEKNDVKRKVENKSTVATHSLNYTDHEKALLGWAGSEYTLQLVGLSSEKSAQEFIAEQPNKKDLYLFKGVRQGKDWYVVVTGRFASSAKARQAVLMLPEAQKKASPWPREVKVIQQEIKQR